MMTLHSFRRAYYNWRNPDGDYADILSFCNSVLLEHVRKLDYVLSQGRYVGLLNDEDDFDFDKRFAALQIVFGVTIGRGKRLKALIQDNLAQVESSKT